LVIVTTEGNLQTPAENDGHNRRVNLIERQRDPQRERSGLDRAVADTAERRLSSLLPVE
jgi:hypothetical protein